MIIGNPCGEWLRPVAPPSSLSLCPSLSCGVGWARSYWNSVNLSSLLVSNATKTVVCTWQLHHSWSCPFVNHDLNTESQKSRLAERKREHRFKCSKQPNRNRSARSPASVRVTSVIANLRHSKTHNYRALFPKGLQGLCYGGVNAWFTFWTLSVCF